MHFSRVFACIFLPSVVGVAAMSAATDQSVADFKAPSRAPAPAPAASAENQASMPRDASVGLPPRIVLATPNLSVAHDEGKFVFKFARASMPEAVAAIATLFRVRAIYAGSPTRVMSGEFAATTIEEALARLVDSTNLRYGAERGIWIIRETPSAMPELSTLKLAAVLTPAGSPDRELAQASAETTSAATAAR